MKSSIHAFGVDMAGKEDQTRMKKAFGNWLRQRLAAKGMNQSDLARAAEIGRDAVSTYVNGRSFPEPDNITKIAHALGLPVEELYAAAAQQAGDPSGPAFTIRQDPHDPSRVFLSVNRSLSMITASQIIETIKQEIGLK